MNKMVGKAEFKAHCLRIMNEAERTGETVIITQRGKPVMELKPIKPKERKPLFGCMKGSVTIIGDLDDEPAYDGPWNAELGLVGDED